MQQVRDMARKEGTCVWISYIQSTMTVVSGQEGHGGFECDFVPTNERHRKEGTFGGGGGG